MKKPATLFGRGLLFKFGLWFLKFLAVTPRLGLESGEATASPLAGVGPEEVSLFIPGALVVPFLEDLLVSSIYPGRRPFGRLVFVAFDTSNIVVPYKKKSVFYEICDDFLRLAQLFLSYQLVCSTEHPSR